MQQQDGLSGAEVDRWTIPHIRDSKCGTAGTASERGAGARLAGRPAEAAKHSEAAKRVRGGRPAGRALEGGRPAGRALGRSGPREKIEAS
ncbi:hypothetical protein MSAS_47070 [Mycobacterium saskatchewanense]|nr:hypothetical protein MSAS_47070 [Mycobacterium saskatchewanense]